MSRTRFSFCPCYIALLLTAINIATLEAQVAATPKTANPTEEATKWISSYSKIQVLFHEKDIARLKEKLAKASPEQAQEWLDDTKEIRNALDSARWNETRMWLKDFLRVQAIYSDEQIAHFRTDVESKAKEAKGAPKKFIDILLDIEQKRLKFGRGAKNDELVRQQKVALATAYHKDQANRRDSQRLAAARAARSRPVAPGPPQRRNYQRPPAIVNSVDVARWSVMRGFWPNNW